MGKSTICALASRKLLSGRTFDRRMMFSRKVFCGATSPLRPVGIFPYAAAGPRVKGAGPFNLGPLPKAFRRLLYLSRTLDRAGPAHQAAGMVCTKRAVSFWIDLLTPEWPDQPFWLLDRAITHTSSSSSCLNSIFKISEPALDKRWGKKDCHGLLAFVFFISLLYILLKCQR